MRNNKQLSKAKLFGSVQAIDRQISKKEREIRKVSPDSSSYTRLSSELFQLRQKRAKLHKGIH